MIKAIRYLEDDPVFNDGIPYEPFGHPDQPEERLTNCHYILRQGIEIHDIRHTDICFDLNTTGFTYVKHQTKIPLESKYFEKVGSSHGGNSVVSAYLEESIAFMKEFIGASKVICFDWRFRRSGAPPTGSSSRFPDDAIFVIRLQAVSPGLDAHCDFSYRGGMERLEMHLLPEEMELLHSGKYTAKIINTWRPYDTVKNAPLIITDRRSVSMEDLLEVEKVIPDKVERAYYLLHRPQTKWYYMSEQTAQDLAVFTTWDSEQPGSHATAPPHGAASQFSEDWATNPRESIEVRFIVLSPKTVDRVP